MSEYCDVVSYLIAPQYIPQMAPTIPTQHVYQVKGLTCENYLRLPF
jgi:hypothetical protein